MANGRCKYAFLFLFFTLNLGFATSAVQSAKEPEKSELINWNGDFTQGWQQYDQLTNELKYQTASSLVEKMLVDARAKKNNDEWTRCLIRYAQLQMSNMPKLSKRLLMRMRLYNWEGAVRFLKDQPWPDDLMSSSVLNLYYAQALTNYARKYSYEINRREKVDSEGVVDLKAWTLDQINEEAQIAFNKIWKVRGQLGGMPKTEWSEYIEPNNYPVGIRPALRDAVSYLWVEMLADTKGWSPDQLSQIDQLNLKKLVEGNIDEFSLVDPAQHPLQKICFILSDLENWHSQKGEREAALEARLERYRILHERFRVYTKDRKFIRNDLENFLKPLASVPWWAKGMAQLAEFIQSEDEPDSLIRARQIAIVGAAVYPESIGGKKCRAIQKDIEMPDYSLSGMQNDNPREKSLLVTHKNLEKVFFRAYSIDLLHEIEASRDYSLPEDRALENLIAQNSPSHQWDVTLPDMLDYQMHRTFVIPPMTKPGAYVIVASARPEFSYDDNELHGLYMTVGNLALISREEAGGLVVTVFSGTNGRPVAGAEARLYQSGYGSQSGQVRQKKTILSDKQGIVRFPIDRGKYGDYSLVARHGGYIAYDLHQYYDDRDDQSSKHSTIIYADRSIYRPLQKILWKAVLYKSSPYETRFETAPASALTISLKDLNGQVVEFKTVTTNSFGTASGEFVIPSGRALGQWHLQSSEDGQIQISVEEYKRPTFEAKILDPEEPLRINKAAHIKGEAKYFFGLPVSSGAVKWSVRRSYPSRAVASGTELLGENGIFTIAFLPELDEKLAKYQDVAEQYSISADITDKGGETRSVERTFRIGFVSVIASTQFDKLYPLEGAPKKINIFRQTLDGIPKAGKGTWKIVDLKAPSKTLLPAEHPRFVDEESKRYQTPGDMERERWDPYYEVSFRQWKEGSIQASGSISHDDKGMGNISAPHLAPGAYRLVYETVDDFGAKYELESYFLVAASSMPLPFPALLFIDNMPAVGEKGRILVHSGFKDQFMVLEIYRAGECIQRKELISQKYPSIVEIPITEKDRGGLLLRLSLLRDSQFIQFEGFLMVRWDDKKLKVEFSTFRDRLKPGQNESWTVKVTDPAGKDAAVPAAELLAYMYDRSLDALVPHIPADPLNLYLGKGLWIRAPALQTNLRQAESLWLNSGGFDRRTMDPTLLKDRLKDGFDGMAIILDNGPSVGRVLNGPPRVINSDMGDFANDKGSVLLPAGNRAFDSDAQMELRRDFRETAFWQPHLLTGPDGSVSFEFNVPDSVTSWNVWIHAITQDFKSGFVNREAQSVKELMVRPYLPRFLREGDQAEIKVVVNNASDHELKGALNFDIIDVATDKSVLVQFGLSKSDTSDKLFTIAKGGGTNLTFPIKTPVNVGQVAFKVTATSGDFSDGELRPIPILPGRMHLMQSRFVTLKDLAQRVMRFDDLARNNDPTRINEQMVVTLDAQLFYSVLSALPYLVNYPYECAEQTLNRFVSTGILSSLYQQYPAIERMAKELSSRETRFEKWDEPDPNRKMALEETPWLQISRGGDDQAADLLNVLDSRIAKAQQETSLAKLRQMQTPSGGFSWFPGGQPSPYMTLYLLHGFSKALEFGVDVPREMIKSAWRYTHQHYLDDVVRAMMVHDSGWEFVTFINYVLSNYPDNSWYQYSFTPEERKTMLDFSFKHWKAHSLYLKGYLALTLKRMDRSKDAMLVWESVMDSAQTAEDQGTFWAPEDRAWLWYNDTIETHAFAIRTTMELMPDHPKLDGMVQWLFLNKKMNHWKSTRATAEVVYSLAHYLKNSGQLGIREDATVTVGNQKTEFIFEPDQYTGKNNQIVIPGEKINSNTSVAVEKTSKGQLFASATWSFSTEKLPEEDRGDYLKLSRSYFKRVNTGTEFVLQPLLEGAVLVSGDEVEVHLSLTSKHPMEYVHLRDPRAAGFEPSSNLSRHKWDWGMSWYEEIRDSGTNFFFERLPQGEYTFKYRIRAATTGVFKIAPATVQPMYAPEFSAYSSGASITISIR